MSHVTKVQTEIKDLDILKMACERVGADGPENGTHVIYGREIKGIKVTPKGWRHPLVVNLNTGELHYEDDCPMTGLEELKNAYATCLCQDQLERQGMRIINVEGSYADKIVVSFEIPEYV